MSEGGGGSRRKIKLILPGMNRIASRIVRRSLTLFHSLYPSFTLCVRRKFFPPAFTIFSFVDGFFLLSLFSHLPPPPPPSPPLSWRLNERIQEEDILCFEARRIVGLFLTSTRSSSDGLTPFDECLRERWWSVCQTWFSIIDCLY